MLLQNKPQFTVNSAFNRQPRSTRTQLHRGPWRGAGVSHKQMVAWVCRFGGKLSHVLFILLLLLFYFILFYLCVCHLGVRQLLGGGQLTRRAALKPVPDAGGGRPHRRTRMSILCRHRFRSVIKFKIAKRLTCLKVYFGLHNLNTLLRLIKMQKKLHSLQILRIVHWRHLFMSVTLGHICACWPITLLSG